MGGGVWEDQFLEGSVLGASFWRWWNRAWAGGEQAEAEAEAPATVTTTTDMRADHAKMLAEHANCMVARIPAHEFECIAAVVPKSRPPRRPAQSKPIDIPTKKAVSAPVFEVAEDKRYWYQ